MTGQSFEAAARQAYRATESATEYTGEVINVVAEKGYYFIESPQLRNHVFAHATEIRGRRRLNVGDAVLFKLSTDALGRRCARRVELLEEAGE